MKKTILFLLLLGPWLPRVALGCDLCEKNQPAPLRGITHGVGPDSDWDLVIIAIAAVMVLLTLLYSIRYLVRPGESEGTHIKNIVVEK